MEQHKLVEKNTNVKKELHSRLCYSICSWIFIKGGFLLRPMCTLPWKAGWHVFTLALECLKGQPLKRIWSVGGVSADTTMHVHTHTHRNTHTPSYTPTYNALLVDFIFLLQNCSINQQWMITLYFSPVYRNSLMTVFNDTVTWTSNNKAVTAQLIPIWLCNECHLNQIAHVQATA